MARATRTTSGQLLPFLLSPSLISPKSTLARAATNPTLPQPPSLPTPTTRLSLFLPTLQHPQASGNAVALPRSPRRNRPTSS